MTQLAATTNRKARSTSTQSFRIANAQQLYVGGYACLNSSGLLVPFTGANGQLLVGRILGGCQSASDGTLTLLGDTSAIVPPEATVLLEPEILEKVTVAGASTLALAMGKEVYLNATDNATADLTLTRPTTGSQVLGVVVRWYSGSICDVLIPAYQSRFLASAVGNGMGNTFNVHLGHVEAATGGPLSVAASQFGTKWRANFHGKIVSTFAYITGATLTGGPVTVTPTIDPGAVGSPVAITGGAMVILVTAAAKSRIAGSAVTAGNEFHAGDDIDLVTSTVTAITGGGVDFWAVVEALPGV
jgi:hypothetical protein